MYTLNVCKKSRYGYQSPTTIPSNKRHKQKFKIINSKRILIPLTSHFKSRMLVYLVRLLLLYVVIRQILEVNLNFSQVIFAAKVSIGELDHYLFYNALLKHTERNSNSMGKYINFMDI